MNLEELLESILAGCDTDKKCIELALTLNTYIGKAMEEADCYDVVENRVVSLNWALTNMRVAIVDAEHDECNRVAALAKLTAEDRRILGLE